MNKFLFSLLFLAGSICWLNAQIPENQLVRIAKFKDNKSAAISYTFDDGMKEHYTRVAPELEKRGFRGTFWVNGNTINRNEPLTTDTTRTNWAELKEMAQRGHEISNHGWSHKNLTKLDDAGVMEEIGKNDSIILARVGVKPVTYCYAGNAKNDRIIRLASSGRVGTRTFQRSIGSKATDESLVKWVDELIEKGEWGVGMTHGISCGYDYLKQPQVLWKHLDYVKSIENKIWVGTFREVSAYAAERDSVRLKIFKKKNSLKITPSHSPDSKLFAEPLTLVVNSESKPIKSIRQGKTQLVYNQISATEIIVDFDPSGKQIKIKYAKK